MAKRYKVKDLIDFLEGIVMKEQGQTSSLVSIMTISSPETLRGRTVPKTGVLHANL
jgi:hypothetical protein